MAALRLVYKVGMQSGLDWELPVALPQGHMGLVNFPCL